MFGWGVKTVSVDELAQRMKRGGFTLIDVREPHEFAAGHVKGAVNIPLGSLASSVARIDADQDVYLICHSGHRSAKAARTLARAGFGDAYSVKGGTVAWPGKLER